MFEPTHKIVTQADKARTNGVVHTYQRGTLVKSKATYLISVHVVSADGTVQFVLHSDLEAL